MLPNLHKMNPSPWSIDLLQKAWHLAASQHQDQTYFGPRPGETWPYLHHIGQVSFEIMQTCHQEPGHRAELALLCAVLHDILEDTDLNYNVVEKEFGQEVAQGVQALSKNANIADKTAQMQDSLDRIRTQPRAVWLVKMADRISNLTAPPAHWSSGKRAAYKQEAQLIHDALAEASPYLAGRLQLRIDTYPLT